MASAESGELVNGPFATLLTALVALRCCFIRCFGQPEIKNKTPSLI